MPYVLRMSIADNPHRFTALKAHFAALCEADTIARSRCLERLAHEDPALATALAKLLDDLDPDDLHPTALPQRIGPFRLLRRLGEGGMGEVFLGVRETTDFTQHAAIKRVRQTALSESLHLRFLRERQMLARLQHPGIARLIDGGIGEDGRAWLAMEYVEGDTLLRAAQVQNWAIEQRIDVLRKIGDAVAHAHRHLVVHRDLKPRNVLVTPEGEPRLLDFGIAQWLDEDAEATRTALRAHTPRYAAPEQITGDRATTATDIHALGVLLYELVAGCSPFVESQRADAQSDATIDWRHAVLTQSPRPLADALRPRRAQFTPRHWQRITGDLDRIVRKALAKSPSERYSDVAALDADLSDWLVQRPLRSGIGSAREQTLYLLRRYRWPLALAGAVVLALGIGAVIALHQARHAQQQARIAQEHLTALLDVLGSANPHRYAGRDPVASEFLIDAATQLTKRDNADQELVRRALTEIGHGLINLGKLAEAETALAQALDAAQRDPRASADTQLAILALLATTQYQPEARARLSATLARIEALCAHATPEAAIDALARVGGAMSKTGDGDAARRLFAQMQSLLPAAPKLPFGTLENAQRQRGWAALRHMNLATATQALTQAAQIAQQHPEEFSALRRAEAEQLLAQLELIKGDAQAALTHLDLARPAYVEEYPPTHPERAAFEAINARAWLLADNTDAAHTALHLALPVLAAHQNDYAIDLAHALSLSAVLSAQLGDCDSAQERLTQAMHTSLPLTLPRDRVISERLIDQVRQTCPAAP